MGYNQNTRTSTDITIGPRAFLEYPFSTPFYEYQDSLTGLGLPYEFDKYVDTVTFGRNSTKHVLAEAIAQAMEPMIMDGVEPFPIAYQSESPEDALIILERDDLAATQDLREYLNRSGAAYAAYFHQPISYWEFIHPTLPIVRVIVEGKSRMPFARPGEIPGYVGYQVGFVMTFQNRWQSFDDPNRWLTRFRNTTVRRGLKIDEDEEGIAATMAFQSHLDGPAAGHSLRGRAWAPLLAPHRLHATPHRRTRMGQGRPVRHYGERPDRQHHAQDQPLGGARAHSSQRTPHDPASAKNRERPKLGRIRTPEAAPSGRFAQPGIPPALPRHGNRASPNTYAIPQPHRDLRPPRPARRQSLGRILPAPVLPGRLQLPSIGQQKSPGLSFRPGQLPHPQVT